MGDVTAAGTGATGLGTRAARWALGFVWLLSLAWGVVTGSLPSADPVELLPYATLFVGGLLLSTPGGQPLDRVRSVGVAASSVATVVLVLARMDAVGDTWLGNLGYYLVALQIARGNRAAGGTGAALALGYGLWWGLQAQAEPAALVDLLAIPALAVGVGVTWQAVLRRVVEREREHRTEAARAAREAEAAAEATEANRRDLAEIRVQVAPLLEQIVAGHRLDDLHTELSVVEGAIRDRIRSPGLQYPSLIAVAADRRRHGVQVVLLGEDDGGPALEPGLAEAVSGLVATASGGKVTVRVSHDGRRPGASVLLERDGVRQRVMIDPDGTVASIS